MSAGGPLKWVILDRDGVINHDSPHYIKSSEEWRPIAGSLEAIARLTQAGWRVCLATNQAGIGRGKFDYDALAAMHGKMQKLAGEHGGRIDAIAFAPEHPDHASEMRKPAPGMLKDLARRLGTALDNVWFIGDSLTDVNAALAAGAKPVLVRTGNGLQCEAEARARHAVVFDDLAAAVNALLSGDQRPQTA